MTDQSRPHHPLRIVLIGTSLEDESDLILLFGFGVKAIPVQGHLAIRQ